MKQLLKMNGMILIINDMILHINDLFFNINSGGNNGGMRVY